MLKFLSRRVALIALLGLVLCGSSAMLARAAASDPLPSWNDGPTKQSILDFVARVTKEGGPDYVAPKDRLATIDNDGTLWVEQPIYTQFAFAIDEVKAQANKHPEWKTTEPFKSILAGDVKGLAASGEKGMVEVMAATHSGMTTTDFDKTVKAWLGTAKHPTSKCCTPTLSTSRCLSSSTIFAPTASRPSSSRAAGWSSCATLPTRPTAFRPSR